MGKMLSIALYAYQFLKLLIKIVWCIHRNDFSKYWTCLAVKLPDPTNFPRNAVWPCAKHERTHWSSLKYRSNKWTKYKCNNDICSAVCQMRVWHDFRKQSADKYSHPFIFSENPSGRRFFLCLCPKKLWRRKQANKALISSIVVEHNDWKGPPGVKLCSQATIFVPVIARADKGGHLIFGYTIDFSYLSLGTLYLRCINKPTTGHI